MIDHKLFREYAQLNNYDLSFNPGSKFYNSRETRIVYYLYVGEL